MAMRVHFKSCIFLNRPLQNSLELHNNNVKVL